MKKVLLALLIIGALVGGYVYFFMLNKAHPDYEHMEADLKINAEELFHDCRDGNALKYTGKLIEVRGVPTSIDVSDSLKVLVFVYDEGMFGPEGVRATLLNHYNDAAKNISFDKEIMIKAYCTGYNDSDVILEKTSIIQP